MTAAINSVNQSSETSTPNQSLLLRKLRSQPVPQEKPGTHLLSSILDGTILLALGTGALVLALFVLMPALFVALAFFIPVLSLVFLLGLSIVLTHDVDRERTDSLSFSNSRDDDSSWD